MKKASRIVALLMALIMVLGTLAACTSGSTTEAPKTTEGGNTTKPTGGTAGPADTAESLEISDALKAAIADKRFDGEQIGIVVSGGSFATRSIAVDKDADDYDPNYSVNVAVEKRNTIIQDELGVKINPEETVSMQAMIEYMRNHFSAPTVDLDIVGVYQYFDIGLAFGDFNGSFYNYNALTETGDNFINIDAPYDKEHRAASYSFTQCPNAEFAKKHGLLHVLPLLCNSDFFGISRIHGTLIRCGTCGNSDRCDYLVVGNHNPVASEYATVTDEGGFLISRRKGE